MKNTFENFYRYLFIAFAICAFTTTTNAAVTQRATAKANAAAAARNQNRSVGRMATSTVTNATATTPEPEPEPEPEPATEPDPEPVIVVDNKTSMFNDVMAEIGASESDRSIDERAEAIRRQRALLDGSANQSTTTASTNVGAASACDTALRQCMAEKCGNDFSKCANDSTTIWGQKIDGCRAKTKCTGHEYTLIAPEILADRDMNVRMAHYNSVIDCGNRYNNCIFTQCGTTLNKCLAKKDGDNAVSKCASIANECKAMDNGLASRAMGVFGDLRKIATARVSKDEARLYELRDLMRNQCTRLGAMFDERTLDCVYTVNFFAGDDNTLMASKKLYSGDSFQCNANWFGIDITTYIENAQRLTRSQKSASAAAWGAGVGTMVGALSSGAIVDRAIDTAKARQAVKEAEDCSATLRSTTHVKSAKYDANGNCIVICRDKYKKTDDGLECVPTAEQAYKIEKQQGRIDQVTKTVSEGGIDILKTGQKVFGDTANVVATGVVGTFSPQGATSMANASGQIAQGKYNTSISGGLNELSGGTPGLQQIQNSLQNNNSPSNLLNGYRGMGNQPTQ